MGEEFRFNNTSKYPYWRYPYATGMFNVPDTTEIGNEKISEYDEPQIYNPIIYETKRIPNFLERLAIIDYQKAAFNSDIVQSIFPMRYFLDVSFAHNIQKPTATKLINGKFGYGKAIQDGLINKLILYFKSFEPTGLDVPIEALAPFLELHRPQIEGCISSVTLSGKDKTKGSIVVKIFGLGGAAGIESTISCEDTITTTKECLLICLGVKALAKIYKNKKNKEILLIEADKIINWIEATPFKPNYKHNCTKNFKEICDNYEYYAFKGIIKNSDYLRIMNKQGPGCEIVRERKYTVEVGKRYVLSYVYENTVDKNSFAIGIESETIQSIQIYNKFESDHNYIGFPEVNSEKNMPIYWAWD